MPDCLVQFLDLSSVSFSFAFLNSPSISNPADLSPAGHPAMGRVPVTFEPRRLVEQRGGARSPVAQRFAAAAHLKPFFAIEPAELLVVHDEALTREQDMQASIAEPAAHGRQLAQPGPHGRIVRPAAAIAHRGAVGSSTEHARRSLTST